MTAPYFPTDNTVLTDEVGTEATVTVGEVTFDDETGNTNETNDVLAVITDYMIKSQFQRDPQKYALPIASPMGYSGMSVGVVQLAANTLIWQVDWTACRAYSKPSIPSTTVQNGGWVLLNDWYEPTMITLMADGVTPLYRISGTYLYVQTSPATSVNQNMTWPRPPWMTDVNDRTVPSSLFVQNLTDVAELSGFFT